MTSPATPDINSLLPRLQRWYVSNCDGEWEHGYGVQITTLDNPGWWVRIDLEGTPLKGRAFEPIRRGVDPDWPEIPHGDWMMVSVKEDTFDGAGGPRQLAELIATFLEWAEDAGG